MLLTLSLHIQLIEISSQNDEDCTVGLCGVSAFILYILFLSIDIFEIVVSIKLLPKVHQIKGLASSQMNGGLHTNARLLTIIFPIDSLF